MPRAFSTATVPVLTSKGSSDFGIAYESNMPIIDSILAAGGLCLKVSVKDPIKRGQACTL